MLATVCVRACVSPSLEVLDAVRRGRDVESPHVLVHLGEALLDVVLGAALPHRGKAETLGRVMELDPSKAGEARVN